MSGLKRKPERLFFIGQFVRLRRQGNWRFRPFRFLRGKRGLRRLSDVGGVKILQIFSGRPKIIIKRIQHLLDIASCRPNPRRCVWLGEGCCGGAGGSVSFGGGYAGVEGGYVAACRKRSEEHTYELQSLIRISYAL